MNQSGESENSGNGSTVLSPEKMNASNEYMANFLTEDEDYIFDNPFVRYTCFCLYSTVFCLCFFGNLAVVLVVTLHWRMRSKTKFCLGNLAFANLCVGIFCVFQNLTTFLTDRWVFGHFMCKMYHFINSLSHTSSILILVVICVERYLALLHPFKNRKWITLTRLKVVIVTVWIISAVLCSPRLYYITTYNIRVAGWNEGAVRYEMICAPQQSLYDAHIIDTAYFILLFLVPLIVISILYTLIGIRLWRDDGLSPKKSESNSNSFRKTINSETLSISSGSGSSGSERQRGSVRVGRTSRQFHFRRRRAVKYSLTSNVFLSSSSVTSQNDGDNVFTSIDMLSSETSDTLSDKTNFSRGNSVSSAKTEKKDLNSLSWRKIQCKKVQNEKCPCTKTYLRPSVTGCRSADKQTMETRDCFHIRKTGSEVLNCSPASDKNPGNGMCRETRCPKPSKFSLKRLVRCKRLESNLTSDALRKKRRRSRQAVLRMMIVIVLTFSICNLPFHIRKLCVNYLHSYDFSSHFSNLFAPFTFLLMYTNCAVNPIIYAFMSTDFRRSLQDFVKCQFKRKPISRKHYVKPLHNSGILAGARFNK